MRKKITLFSFLLMAVGIFSSFVFTNEVSTKFKKENSRQGFPACLKGKMYNSQQQGAAFGNSQTLPIGYTGISMDCSGPYIFTQTGGNATALPTGPAAFYVNGTAGQSVTVLITGPGTIGNRTVMFRF